MSKITEFYFKDYKKVADGIKRAVYTAKFTKDKEVLAKHLLSKFGVAIADYYEISLDPDLNKLTVVGLDTWEFRATAGYAEEVPADVFCVFNYGLKYEVGQAVRVLTPCKSFGGLDLPAIVGRVNANATYTVYWFNDNGGYETASFQQKLLTKGD